MNLIPIVIINDCYVELIAISVAAATHLVTCAYIAFTIGIDYIIENKWLYLSQSY